MFNAPHPPTRTRLKVLVVDDDPLLADVLAIQLDQLGCDVSTATEGGAGLALLAEREIDMLVTDWQMPGIDGMEVVRRARAARTSEGYLHIVMMTARGDAAAMRTALEAGVDDFLEKPVLAIQLEIAVECARRNRLLHRRLERRNSLLAIAHERTRDALERVRSDLDAATSLHERLLPEKGRLGSLNVSHIYRPAAVLGGDSIGLSALREGGVLFFVIDVKGHGVPAALESFHLHHRIKQLRPTTPESLGKMLEIVNAEILERGGDSYATVVCGLLIPEWEEGWLVCAGHPPPILADGRGAALIEGGRSMPVGWFEGTRFEPVRFDFPQGARLLLYSDGITECTDETGEEFGVQRLADMVGENRAVSLGDVVQGLELGLITRRAAAGFEDDISLLAIEHRIREADDER